MCYLLYLMFRCDFNVMESLEELVGSDQSPCKMETGVFNFLRSSLSRNLRILQGQQPGKKWQRAQWTTVRGGPTRTWEYISFFSFEEREYVSHVHGWQVNVFFPKEIPQGRLLKFKVPHPGFEPWAGASRPVAFPLRHELLGFILYLVNKIWLSLLKVNCGT